MYKYKVPWVYDYYYINGELTVKNILSGEKRTVICLEGDVDETFETIIKIMEGDEDEK